MAARKTRPVTPKAGQRWWQVLIRGLLPVLVVVAAGGIYLALAATRPRLEQRVSIEKVWPIKVVKVTIEDHRPALRLYGQIIAGRKVELHALVAGEVVETAPDFAEGARVAGNTLIVRIDPFEYQSRLREAQANLKEGKARLAEIRARVELEKALIDAAREQLELSRRDHRRSTDLRRQGLVAQKAVDDKQIIVRDREQALRQRGGALKVEQARAAQQEAVVDRLSAALERARRALADTRLRAPFSGYLSAINVERGRMLGVNDRVATLIDDRRIDVRFNLSDRQYGRIMTAENSIIDKPVKIFWKAMKNGGTYRATIKRVAAEISAASGGVDVYAALPQHPVSGCRDQEPLSKSNYRTGSTATPCACRKPRCMVPIRYSWCATTGSCRKRSSSLALPERMCWCAVPWLPVIR